jgi:hypothetical protein
MNLPDQLFAEVKSMYSELCMLLICLTTVFGNRPQHDSSARTIRGDFQSLVYR